MFKLFYIMLVFLATSVILVIGAPTQPSPPQPRTIIDFAQFVYHFTNRNPLDYNNYGCWCGSGSDGETVMDDIDMCCKIHDGCYKGWDSLASYYTVNSDWMCTNDPSSEQYKACMCDQEGAQCFARNTYHESLKGRCD